MRGTQVRKVKDHKGLFGNLKGKLSGYVAAYREDMAMVLVLVKFFFPGSALACVSVIIHLSHGFLKHCQLSVAPTLMIFLLFQELFMKWLMAGGLKY